ncbi:MAG: luciferase family protein [Roseibium sp.]
MKILKQIAAFITVGLGILVSATQALAADLPQRSSPAARTTNKVPHIQIGAKQVPVLSEQLAHHAATLPGVEVRNTVISLPGAKGFWISDQIELARPQAIVGGREFAHIHPDGSLHISLSPDRAKEAVDTGWAAFHPWSDRPGWEGFVLLYSPRFQEEADVVLKLIFDGYEYVTGKKP